MATQNSTDPGGHTDPEAALPPPLERASAPTAPLRDRPVQDLIGDLAQLEDAFRTASAPDRSSLTDPELTRLRARERDIIAELRRRLARRANQERRRKTHPMLVRQNTGEDPWSPPW